MSRPGRLSAGTLPQQATLIAIPLVFAIAGLLLRFAAFRAALPDADPWSFVDQYCRWDCLWYEGIAQDGYDPFPTPDRISAGNWAFFPLFPMLVGLAQKLVSLPTMTVATTISVFCAMLSARLAWPLLGRDWRAYVLFSAFILSGPVSVYFTTFYTEVLFLLLTIVVLRSLRQGDVLGAGPWTVLLSATRIVGVFMVFAMLAETYRLHQGRGGNWRNFIGESLKRPVLLLAFVAAPLGLFCYMAYLRTIIGDALAFQHVQRAWARTIDFPLFHLWNALLRFPSEGLIPSVSQQLALAATVGLATAFYLLARRNIAWGVFSLICLLVPLAAGVASMLRFVSALAPVTITLMRLLAANTWVWGLTLVALLAGCYFGGILWLTEYLTLV